jgi:DNA ligase (NAD+)
MTINEIVQQLLKAKEAYYNNEPILSDEEFDNLEEDLRKLDPNNKYFKIVGIVAKGKKVHHNIPMLSCQKAKTVEEVEKWLNKIKLPIEEQLIIEPKIDGGSCTIKYKNGKLVYAATRGTGTEGVDVTHIAKYMTTIPKTLHICVDFEVRGELYLPTNIEYETNGKPLRNIAIGLVNRKDTGLEDLKYLHFIAYQIIGKDIGKEFNYEDDKIEFLNSLGFQTVDYSNFFSAQYDEIKAYYDYYQSTLRSKWGFETDGLVLKVNNCSLHEKIDASYIISHHHNYEIALKPTAEFKETKLINVEWNISRFGTLTPVAIVEPITLGGAIIQRASLHNYKNVIENIKPHIGDIFLIKRSNDVIPYIEENKTFHEEAAPYILPKCCPSCGSGLSIIGVNLKCSNKQCPEQVIQQITSWCKDCEMEQMSTATIRTLYEFGVINSIKALYNLIAKNLSGIPGLGQKKIDNIISEIERTKTMTAVQFIARLGIENVGEKAIKKLKIHTMSDFWSFKGTLQATGMSLQAFKEEGVDYINNLLEVVQISDIEEKGENNMLSKGKVAMTGTGPLKRNELIQKLNEMGYEFAESVNKETSILLCEDPASGSGKLQKAQKLGVKLMSYSEFFK